MQSSRKTVCRVMASLAMGTAVCSVCAIGPPQVGWAWFSGNPLPAGAALFSFVDTSGVLIWEAGIPAVKSTTRGRILVDERGETSTGVAIANVLPFDTVLTLAAISHR